MPAQLAKEASQAGAEPGWAQYVSCNSDETDYFGNKPRDPLCVCWVRAYGLPPPCLLTSFPSDLCSILRFLSLIFLFPLTDGHRMHRCTTTEFSASEQARSFMRTVTLSTRSPTSTRRSAPVAKAALKSRLITPAPFMSARAACIFLTATGSTALHLRNTLSRFTRVTISGRYGRKSSPPAQLFSGTDFPHRVPSSPLVFPRQGGALKCKPLA